MTDGLLPERARRILKEAAATPAFLDNLARRKAVDAAIERVKREFPKHFRENDEGGNVRPDRAYPRLRR